MHTSLRHLLSREGEIGRGRDYRAGSIFAPEEYSVAGAIR